LRSRHRQRVLPLADGYRARNDQSPNAAAPEEVVVPRLEWSLLPSVNLRRLRLARTPILDVEHGFIAEPNDTVLEQRLGSCGPILLDLVERNE